MQTGTFTATPDGVAIDFSTTLPSGSFTKCGASVKTPNGTRTFLSISSCSISGSQLVVGVQDTIGGVPQPVSLGTGSFDIDFWID